MIELLTLLKTKKVLYAENIMQIREGLIKKYPEATSVERALLLSDVIHKILDKNLYEFSREAMNKIKEKLVRKAIAQGQVDLTVYDIIESYMELDYEFLNKEKDLFIKWLQKQAIAQLTEEDVQTIYTYFNIENIDSEVSFKQESHVLARENYKEEVAVANLEIANEQPGKNCGEIVGKVAAGLSMLLAVMVLSTTSVSPQEVVYDYELPTMEEWLEELIFEQEILLDNHLQPHLQYKKIDEHALQVFLIGRESLLAQKSYFESILQVAKEFYINPLLLFAITGQEQGFVKASHPRAEEIANNPFNVFGSWLDFNTDILDTSRIAARTILNLSKGCPADEDPIKWLNKKYAEDPEWHKGVTSILNMLEEIAGGEYSW